MSKRKSRDRSGGQPSRPKVDIVITTAGRFDVLKTCLDAVYREAQSVPLGVYIVDNASDAEERIQNESLFRYDPGKDPARGVVRFQSKRLSVNAGFPGAANEGARMGSSDLIMFLSDDVELRAGTLEKVIRNFDDSSIGVVGIKLLFPPDSTDRTRPAGKVQHVGLALNIRATPSHPLVGWSPDHPWTCISRDAWAVTGACYTIRRGLFNRAGGFDMVYGKGTFEDCDLCLKVRQLGYRIRLDAEATAYHYVGATAIKRKEPFPLQQNLMIFQSRWQSSGLMIYDEWLYYAPPREVLSGSPQE